MITLYVKDWERISNEITSSFIAIKQSINNGVNNNNENKKSMMIVNRLNKD